MAVKAVELIVSGRVQRVGYRDFVADAGRALKLVGFVENQKDGTVKIRCKGEAMAVEKFKEAINVKTPPEAPLINVEHIDDKPLEEGDVTESFFEERYGDPNAEIVQGLSTGMRYMVHLSSKMDAGFEKLSAETKTGFAKMDTNFQDLSVKYGKISNTMERIDKNIEKMATKKRGIFD